MSLELLLTVFAFVTSLIAGVIGFGGGMLLISILPFFISPHLIIPMHGVVQLASNSSRMIFSIKYVQWQLLPKFLLGSAIGFFLFGFVLTSIPTAYIPVAIGIYILLNIWSKPFSKLMKNFESFYLIGFFQTGLGLIVGATGPLSLSVLTKVLKCSNEIISTSSMFMTISHLAKLPLFILVGSSFTEELELIIYLVAGAILGSYVGTKLRSISNNEKLILLIKVLLSALAIKMIVSFTAFS